MKCRDCGNEMVFTWVSGESSTPQPKKVWYCGECDLTVSEEMKDEDD